MKKHDILEELSNARLNRQIPDYRIHNRDALTGSNHSPITVFFNNGGLLGVHGESFRSAEPDLDFIPK